MAENTEQKDLVGRFRQNLSYYKATQNAYNEHSCRIENIDPLLEILVSPPIIGTGKQKSPHIYGD